ncbi:SH3 domain-containing kinase-binding protein 1 [Aphelenchoides avenae]|nr:SH3 domain-containing kinase-binding protein 1 [Aphelenchus avenae]
MTPPQATPTIFRSANRTAVVRFSYSAQQEDELNLAEGDVIEVHEDVEDGWARGQLNGKLGLFPTNFVSFAATPVTSTGMSPNTTAPLPRLSEEEKQIDPAADNENNVDNSGNVLPSAIKNKRRVMSTISSNLDGTSPPTTAGAASKPKEYAKVLFEYKADHPDELDLPEGAVITILNKKCEDEGWFEGEHNGKRGLFPENFVKIITSNVATAPSTSSEKTPAAPLTPPTLPAKPTKPAIQPVANGRDMSHLSTTNVTTTFPPTSTTTTTAVAPVDKVPEKEKPEADRKSIVAGLQSKLFPMGVFPPRKPAFGPTAESSTENTQPVFRPNVVSNDRDKTSVSSADEDPAKLECATKSRPKQPNKRPPSTVASRSSMKLASVTVFDESPTSAPHSMSGSVIGFKPEVLSPPLAKQEILSPPLPKSTAATTTASATASKPAAATSTNATQPPVTISAAAIQTGQAKLRTPVPVTSPSSTTITSSTASHSSTAATSHSSSSEEHQWVSRREFDALRREMQQKIDALQAQVDRLQKQQASSE